MMLHASNTFTWAGVCKRLENTIEQLFPQRLAARRCTSPFFLLSCSSQFFIEVLLDNHMSTQSANAGTCGGRAILADELEERAKDRERAAQAQRAQRGVPACCLPPF